MVNVGVDDPPPPPPQLAIRPATAAASKTFPIVVMCDTLSPPPRYFNATTPASRVYFPSASRSLQRYLPAELARRPRASSDEELQQRFEILALGRGLGHAADLHDPRLRRAPSAVAVHAQVASRRRKLHRGAVAVPRDLQPVLPDARDTAQARLGPFRGGRAAHVRRPDLEGIRGEAYASLRLPDRDDGHGLLEQGRLDGRLDVLQAHAAQPQTDGRLEIGAGCRARERNAQPAREDRQRIAAPLDVRHAAEAARRAHRERAAPLPHGAARITERERTAARALEGVAQPRRGQGRQQEHQVRGEAEQGEAHPGAAQRRDHAPCACSSRVPFTVPGLAFLSMVAFSARSPACCSSTSSDIKAGKGAASICTRTLFALSASTRFSCSRRPLRAAAACTAEAASAGASEGGAARRLATSAACSRICASCACTVVRRACDLARPFSTGVHTSRYKSTGMRNTASAVSAMRSRAPSAFQRLIHGPSQARFTAWLPSPRPARAASVAPRPRLGRR